MQIQLLESSAKPVKYKYQQWPGVQQYIKKIKLCIYKHTIDLLFSYRHARRPIIYAEPQKTVPPNVVI